MCCPQEVLNNTYIINYSVVKAQCPLSLKSGLENFVNIPQPSVRIRKETESIRPSYILSNPTITLSDMSFVTKSLY